MVQRRRASTSGSKEPGAIDAGGFSLRTLKYDSKRSETLARQIVREIVDNRYQPGTRLPTENEVIEKNKVARVTAREALRILEVLGLVSIRPGRTGGPSLRRLSSRDFGRIVTFYLHIKGATVRELLETRALIEPGLAYQAAKHATRESSERLLRAVSLHSDSTGQSSDASAHPIHEMHTIIADMSNNRVLSLLGPSLRDIQGSRIAAPVDNSYLARVQHDHEAIAAAVADGDAEAAANRMRAHMNNLIAHLAAVNPKPFDQVIDWRD